MEDPDDLLVNTVSQPVVPTIPEKKQVATLNRQDNTEFEKNR